MRDVKLGLLGLLATVLMVGCGGAGVQSLDTRGEGNIPIGRLSRSAQVQATVTCSTQQLACSVDNQGVIWAPRIEFGPATVSIQPADPSLDALAVPVVFGPNESYVISAGLNDKRGDAVVANLTIDIPNGLNPVVGRTYPIKVTVDGTNVAGMKATIWVDGGVGYIDSGQRFVATTPGSGVVHAKLLNVTADFPVNVN